MFEAFVLICLWGKPTLNEYCEELAKSFKGEKDRPRYEEQSEKEWIKHCERFFKGWDD